MLLARARLFGSAGGQGAKPSGVRNAADACGDDVAYASSQLGHEDPRFTLKVYAQATKRRERLSGPHLKAYDRALDWATAPLPLMGESPN